MPSSTSHLDGDEPAVASRFLFEVNGIEIGIFKEVKGLEMTVKTTPIKEGGQNGYVLQVPGPIEWPNIVFKRGLTASDALFDWISKSSGQGYAGNKNKLQRPEGAVVAIGQDGARIRSWNLRAVFPVKWKGPDFAVAMGTHVPLEEELEISHQGFTATTNSSPPAS